VDSKGAKLTLLTLFTPALKVTTRGQSRPVEVPVQPAEPVIVTPAAPAELAENAEFLPAGVRGDVQQPLTELQQLILKAYPDDPCFQRSEFTKDWVLADDGFWYKGARIVVPHSVRDASGLTLREQVLRLAHDVVGAHLGIAKTLARISAHYWWPGMREEVENWIMTCTECQRNKPRAGIRRQGLLQVLPIPRNRWDSISMDFITSLPTATETANDCILVIVDRFSKLAKFIPCRGTLTAAQCVQLVLDHWCFQGGGIPRSIV
jgi:hypothetical protein